MTYVAHKLVEAVFRHDDPKEFLKHMPGPERAQLCHGLLRMGFEITPYGWRNRSTYTREVKNRLYATPAYIVVTVWSDKVVVRIGMLSAPSTEFHSVVYDGHPLQLLPAMHQLINHALPSIHSPTLDAEFAEFKSEMRNTERPE